MRFTNAPEPERNKSTLKNGYCFSNMAANCLLSGIDTVVYQTIRPSFFAWAMSSELAIWDIVAVDWATRPATTSN